MSPISRPPSTGTATPQQPKWWPCSDTASLEKRRKNAAFVNTAISQSKALATTAPSAPMGRAMAQRSSTRRLVLKSASVSGAPAEAEEADMEKLQQYRTA